jgi:UDP:flavonoid glycosyltransferase YjiC (YdhE family)
LTAEKLAQAIRQTANDTQMRQKAAEIGQKIRCEPGVKQAVEIFNDLIS